MDNNRPTIIDAFNTCVEKYAGNPFLWEKTSDKYLPTTYQECKVLVHQIAAGLLQLGVEPGDKIALLSEGRNAWILGELGILHTGAINVPLSIKLEESNDLIFRLTHSESKYIFVSGNQLKKIRKIIASLPLVQKVIVLDEQQSYEPLEMSLNELMEWGKTYLEKYPESVEQAAQRIQPDDLANISYTSGTTADPKGIMLTHRNYTANVEQSLTRIDVFPYHRILIILPLDHCFAHVAGFYIFMHSGASVGTVSVGKTAIETLKNIPVNMKELKPSLLLSVPALAKNFRKSIESNINSQGKFVQWMFNTGLKMNYSYNKEGYNKGRGLQILKKPLLKLFDVILFKKVRQAFGSELEFFVGGGALLDIELQRFFYAIGIPMYQGYGLSEATPVISTNAEKRHKLGSSGYPVEPMDIKICDEEGRELPKNTKGEIVIRGENVMAGYYKNEKATAETIRNGWLYTGDMGYLDDDGFLYVVGRFKSLLISSDGEKYSPEGIEESLADNSKFIDYVVLYNNQNPYTSALIVPNKEALKAFVKSTDPGLEWDTVEAKKIALKKIQHEVDEYKKGGKHEGLFPERWLPAAVAVIGEPFSEKNGLINSSMKVVRGKVEKLYEDRLKALYEPGAKDIINDLNIKALS